MNLILHSEYRTLEYFLWNLGNRIENPITEVLKDSYNSFNIKASTQKNGRCLIMTVQVVTDKTWFLKQAANFDAIETIKNEFAFYKLIENITTLKAHPKFVYYDNIYDILILEYLEKHKSLSSLVQLASNPESLAKLSPVVNKTAELLALYHKEIPQKLPAAFPYSIPIIKVGESELKPNSITNAESLSLTNAQYNKLFDPYPKKIIEYINKLWEDSSMIHFDFRPDNILVNQDSASVILTDWEMLSLGDPLWDVVTFFSETLNIITNCNVIRRYNARREHIKAINKPFFDTYLTNSGLEKNGYLKDKLKVFWQAKYLSNYLSNDNCEVNGENCFETAINILVDDLW